MHASINSMMTKIWKKLSRKEYRAAFVDAHISNTVASQIAALREAKGWTQKRLADEAGMRQSRISHLENPNYENIEIGTLKKLASAFDVALTVRFVPFSELATWVATLSPSKLSVPSFDSDESVAPAKSPNLTATTGDEEAVSIGMTPTDHSRQMVAILVTVPKGVGIHG